MTFELAFAFNPRDPILRHSGKLSSMRIHRKGNNNSTSLWTLSTITNIRFSSQEVHSTSKLNGEYDRPCRRPFFVWDLMMRQKQNESSCTCAILPTTGSVAPVVHSTGGGQLSAVRRRPQLRQGNTQTKPVVRRAAPDRIGSNGSTLFLCQCQDLEPVK